MHQTIDHYVTDDKKYLVGPNGQKGIIIGATPSMMQVFSDINTYAGLDMAVLIRGATGTGKEMVAQALHYNGKRAGKPFVSINCGGIPTDLLENELFGHAKGGYTNATTEKRGLFEEADGGTIFLDEIGELPLAMQVKLLRVLDSGEVRRIGSNQIKTVHARVIAATNRDLEEMMKQETFREDLFYRLNVGYLFLPPLVERKEDIRPIATYLLDRVNRRYNFSLEGFSPEALQILASYPWRGNIRELDNVIERIVVRRKKGIVTPDDLTFNHFSTKTHELSPSQESAGTNPWFEQGVLPVLLSQVAYGKTRRGEGLSTGHTIQDKIYRQQLLYGLEIPPPKGKSHHIVFLTPKNLQYIVTEESPYRSKMHTLVEESKFTTFARQPFAFFSLKTLLYNEHTTDEINALQQKLIKHRNQLYILPRYHLEGGTVTVENSEVIDQKTIFALPASLAYEFASPGKTNGLTGYIMKQYHLFQRGKATPKR